MNETRLEACASLAALPGSAQALLDGLGAEQLFTSRPWFETFCAAGLAPGAEPLFLVLADGQDRVHALLPCQRRPITTLSEPAVSSLTSFYSCDFRPLIAPQADQAVTALALGRAVASSFENEALFGFDSLDSSLPTLAPFLAGLARPGRALLRYAHFGRWSEDVAGLPFAAYMARRDGALRETVRRKTARLVRAGASFTIVSAADVEQGIADYETVYRASWKEAEPFPDFQPVLMRNLARAGWLRLALCHVAGRPVAAQLWTTVAGRGAVLKLAHDREFDALSPGTALTAFAIRTLIEDDHATTLDFGRGDDPYKQSWTTRRTLHIGVLSASLARRPLLVARHRIGALLRRR